MNLRMQLGNIRHLANMSETSTSRWTDVAPAPPLDRMTARFQQPAKQFLQYHFHACSSSGPAAGCMAVNNTSKLPRPAASKRGSPPTPEQAPRNRSRTPVPRRSKGALARRSSRKRNLLASPAQVSTFALRTPCLVNGAALVTLSSSDEPQLVYQPEQYLVNPLTSSICVYLQGCIARLLAKRPRATKPLSQRCVAAGCCSN